MIERLILLGTCGAAAILIIGYVMSIVSPAPGSVHAKNNDFPMAWHKDQSRIIAEGEGNE